MSGLEQADRPTDEYMPADGIPGYLIAQERWLLWRTETRRNTKGEAVPTKPPISHHTGKKCDAHDPRNWTTYANVAHALAGRTGAWDGAGFALGEVECLGEAVIGADLDSCLRSKDDDPADWALPFLQAMPSFADISPSDTGIKIIARIKLADLPAARRMLDIREADKEQARTRIFGERTNGMTHAPGAQLFLTKRFFTITGRPWPTAPEDVRLLTLGDIARLAEAFGPKEHAASDDRDPANDNDDEPDEATLRAKLEAAKAKNPRLWARWEGGTEGLNDTSRSGRDMSVLAMLRQAGFTKGETRAALRLFEHGKLTEEGPRYFEEMWRRTKATAPDATERRRSVNVLALVTHINSTPAWEGTLRLNLLTEGYEACPPFPPQDGIAKGPLRGLRDPQDTLVATMYFQANGFAKAGKRLVWDALAAAAYQHPYHPIRNYLDGLKWDGTARVGRLFQQYFNAELPETERARDRHVAYLEHISTGFMVGAVARVTDPGCKHDQVPVVVGPERSFKSTAIRMLSHDPAWFTDDLSPNLIERDTKESLAGKWIVELSEIPHIGREAERVKAFFSRTTDRYRAAYGMASQDHPRQCVFIGTSNDLEFVSVTGNRRFWPFRIAGSIDIAAIKADRDQLWAEAVVLFRQGVRWWLPPTIEAIASEQQASFVETDILEDVIARWIGLHPEAFTLEMLFAAGTGITPYREAAAVPKAEQMRAARCLTKLGHRKQQKTIAGKRAVWWERSVTGRYCDTMTETATAGATP
jgi:hypothetical protein